VRTDAVQGGGGRGCLAFRACLECRVGAGEVLDSAVM